MSKNRSGRLGRYRLRNFLFDLLMIALTGGLWLIWIICREMRNRG